MLLKRLLPLLIFVGMAHNSYATIFRGMAALRGFKSSFVNSTASNTAQGFRSSLKAPKTMLKVGIASTAAAALWKYYGDRRVSSPYTINLMWINRGLAGEQKYIFPAKNEEELKEKYLDPIITWSELHPTNNVQVWFDSALTAQEAPQRTLEKIKEHTTNPVILKDVRDLSEVNNNAAVFSHKTPVYFRADLLRVMAALHTLSTTKADHFVYADFDVNPLSKQELFDKTTVEHLEKFGIVVAYNKCLDFENSFQIIGKNNKNLIEALQRTIVDLNIKRAYNALDDQFYNVSGRKDPQGPMKPLQQIVYDSYPAMFHYFYHLEGLGKLKLSNEKIYKYHEHGLAPFGLNQLCYEKPFLVIENEELKAKTTGMKIWMPTKKVDVPPASLNYD